MPSAAGGADLILLERIVFFFMITVAAAIAARTLNRRFRVIRSGRRRIDTAEASADRWKRLLRYVPGQWCNIQNLSLADLAGIQHLFLFFGAVVLALYYALFVVLGDGTGISAGLRQLALLRLTVQIAECFGILVMAGLTWGVGRRTVTRPDRLGPDFEAGTFMKIALGGTVLMLCFYLLEMLRVILGQSPAPGPVSGLLLALGQAWMTSPSQAAHMFHLIWWVQALLIAAFMIYVPFSKHQHAVFSPFNIFQSTPTPRSRFEAVAMDQAYNGLASPEELTDKQRLELYSCTQCGRCQDACPAQATGKTLSPKKIIQDMRRWMDYCSGIRAPWKAKQVTGTTKMRIVDFTLDDEMWSCTTCMACVEACPAFVSALDKIVDLRRDAVLIDGRIYPEVSAFFREVETFGDTFGKGRALREDWILGRNFKRLDEDNKTEVLFWVGCQSTFHDRNRCGATALFDILERTGIDFAILGRHEMCCGDPLRRMGNEYLFQKMARENIAILQKRCFKTIVTYCPHCFNMLKHEYSQLGGNFTVRHYTEYVDDLIARGALELNQSMPVTVTYHDPCYLARGNRIHGQARDIMAAASGTRLLETANAGIQTFCCGGGGGHMWIGGSQGERINERRIRQLTDTGASTVVTSCPYCLVMLEDGVKSLQKETVKCIDLVEFIRERI